MEKYSQIIRNYVTKLLSILETTNSDKAILEIAKELRFNLHFKLLMEELTKIALEEGKVINSFFILKSISKNSSQRVYPEFIQQIKPREAQGKDCEEIFNNITLFKGALLVMIENMGLVRSRAHLIKFLVITEREIDANLIYSESEIKSFNPDEFEDILKEELNEKYRDEQIVIKKPKIIKKGRV